MDELEKSLLLRLSWFRPDRVILGQECRPLSLGSCHAIKTMGLSVLDRGVEMDPLDEIGEVQVYVWLHTAPIAEIETALWNSSWRAALVYDEGEGEGARNETIALLNDWRETKETLIALLDATEIETRAKPPRPGVRDDTPADVVSPSVLAHKLQTLMSATGLDEPTLFWELSVFKANQLYHSAMRMDGFWTVPKMERSAPETFENFSLAALQEPEPEPVE